MKLSAQEYPAVSDSILDTIGNTPVVRLRRLAEPGWAAVLVKLESRNPGGSVKDRIALAMIDAAEAEGRLRPGDTVVEPTSGNTGIGLAVTCAVKGYRLVLTMPDDMSLERRRLLTWMGAEVVLTPAIEGMSGAVWAAEELVDKHGYFMPRQFENPANPAAHRRTTAEEILSQTGRNLDALVFGVGTGGTLTGVGEVLRKALPDLHIVAVEPARSPVLSGGRPGLHNLHGLGAGFVPGVLNTDLINAVIPCNDSDAYDTARRLAREEGILCGWSSGAAAWAALRVARELGSGRTVLALLPDTGERYLSMMKD